MADMWALRSWAVALWRTLTEIYIPTHKRNTHFNCYRQLQVWTLDCEQMLCDIWLFVWLVQNQIEQRSLIIYKAFSLFTVPSICVCVCVCRKEKWEILIWFVLSPLVLALLCCTRLGRNKVVSDEVLNLSGATIHEIVPAFQYSWPLWK